MNSLAEEVLMHHGVLGMKWGIRRYQNKDGTLTAEGKKRYYPVLKTLEKSKTKNLNKWGKSQDTNVLYVMGLSGSGKSSLSSFIGDDKKTDIIHLDMYFNQMSKESRTAYQNKSFNSFLDKRVKDWKQIPSMINTGINDPKTWKKVDEFAKALDDFGKYQFGKKKVVAEGVQLIDSTMHPDKKYYSDKPVVIIQTSPTISALRGSIRDSVDPITFLQRAYGKQTLSWNSDLKTIANQIDAKKGDEWIKNYLQNVEID